jgi:hypothetical protein
VLQFAVGLWGFRPAYRSLSEYSPAIVEEEFQLREVTVFQLDSFEIPLRVRFDKTTLRDGEQFIEGAEMFISGTKRGITVDEEGLYNYALSHGMTEDSNLRVVHIPSLRLDMGGVAAVYENYEFTVKELKVENMDVDYTEDQNLFTLLTDVFF